MNILNNNFKELPLLERPREKAIKKGFRSLSNTELLAIFLRTGTVKSSVLNTAQELIELAGGFSELINIKREKIMKIKGIGVVKSLELLATFEFVKRIKSLQIEKKQLKINDPEDVYKILEYEFEDEKQENFYVLLLNKDNIIIDKKQIYQGTSKEIVIDLRDIFGYALKNNAMKIICSHNHPSGNSIPSLNDKKTTKIIKEVSMKLNIPLIDHIVFGKNEYFSILLNKKFLIKK